MQGKSSAEILVHFNCAACSKWWTIGDPPLDKTEWFCPWCGQKQTIPITKNSNQPSAFSFQPGVDS